MKKVMALLLCGVLLFAFAGCGKAEKKSNTKNNSTSSETGKTENTKDKVTKTELYKDADLSEYVTLCDYKLTLKDGIVETGDVANIDYTGKKNGVAFEGGTAQGYNLTIGSGTFIPGFEDGLVGVKVGATVDLDLTFPENYGSEELAGAAVVFTVKVNSIEKPLIKKYSDGCTIKSYPKNDMADALSLANVTDY
ncbi:MAG: FKBP-type peptidyl-prolyl cis-trans isomerase [Clostridia bacterium]|nr:FKBP-type peptidyl-prolyl cis-trans isomerase [Clostridia bacterium]